MSTENYSIIIFSPDWRVLATVAEGVLVMRTPEEQTQQLASWVLAQLSERDPQLMSPVKDESGCVIGFETARPGDPRYMEAVRDELRRASLKAYVVPSGIEAALAALSEPDIAADIRSQIVPEVLGLPFEQALTALEAVLVRSRSEAQS